MELSVLSWVGASCPHFVPCFEHTAAPRYPQRSLRSIMTSGPNPGELTVFLAQCHLAGYHDRFGGSVHIRIGPLIQ
jgi:hypothetical protein